MQRFIGLLLIAIGVVGVIVQWLVGIHRYVDRSVEPGTVRGGIRGHQHNNDCKVFERRQAASLGMPTVV